jgi:hypothetical protein
MPKIITSADRIRKARELIQKAYRLPLPDDGGKYNLSYIAQVKDLLRQARDLVKFIPDTPTATQELKEEVKKVFAEADKANQELLH